MLEQFGPGEVVGYTALAEQHGFSGCMAADHFQPWVPQQGQAAFVWNVLAAVGERTRGDLGPGVTCPSFRFHPAMVAQAAATLEAMYPGRSPGSASGTGEALNEHVVAGYWPEAGRAQHADVRGDRGRSPSCSPPRWQGKDVKHDGARSSSCESTRLWTMPERPPPILVATAGPINAKRTGRFADGIITVGAPLEKIGDAVRAVRRRRPGGRQGPGHDAEGAAAAPVLGGHRRGGADQRRHRVAERRDEVRQGRHPLPVRLRADGQAGPARGLRGPDGDLRRPGRPPRAHPAVRRPRASTGSTCTTSGATRPSGSRSSAATSCPSSTAEDQSCCCDQSSIASSHSTCHSASRCSSR